MRIQTIATLAIFSIGSLTSAGIVPSFAASTAPGGSICNSDHRCPPGNNGGVGCTVICPPSDDPPPTVPGDPKVVSAQLKVCGDKLQQLRRVSAAEIRSIHQQDEVKVVPVCESAYPSLTENQIKLGDRGNAAGLITAIAGNPVMVAELGDTRHRPDDVIGVAIGDNAAILYVHRQ